MINKVEGFPKVYKKDFGRSLLCPVLSTIYTKSR